MFVWKRNKGVIPHGTPPPSHHHTLTFSTASLLLAASILHREEVPCKRERGGGGDISPSPLSLPSSGGSSNLVTRGCSLRLRSLCSGGGG